MKTALLVVAAIAVSARADFGSKICVTVDFDDEPIGEISTVTMNSIRGTINITSSESYPAIYDTNDPTGNDAEDLGNPSLRDGIDLGKVLIIQEDHKSASGAPDDRFKGGTLFVDFSNFGDTSTVTFDKIKVIDVSSAADALSKIVLRDQNGTILAVSGVQELGSGSVQTIDFQEQEGVAQLEVILEGSAAVDDIEVCLDESSFVLAASVTDDPHVHTIEGHQVDIHLKPYTWISMLASPRFALSGRVFCKSDDETKQWFDGVALVDAATFKTVFNATIPRDNVGLLGRKGEIQYFHATLDNEALKASNTTYNSKDGRVKIGVSKLRSATRRGVLNDIFKIATPDFTFSIESSRETKRELFSTREEQLSLTHIDIRFKYVPHPEDFAGPLAELMFPSIITSKSREAVAWLEPGSML